jgi:hypothetical protein
MKNPFKLGDKVKLRPDVLQRHSRSVPTHAGYTKEQFKWRDLLRKIQGAGEVGVVDRVIPGDTSKHTNVRFETGYIGIDFTELIPATETKE